MSIGSNIRMYREAKGWSQEKLAERLGVTFQAVSSWERDEYRPEFETFIKLTEKVLAQNTISSKQHGIHRQVQF